MDRAVGAEQHDVGAGAPDVDTYAVARHLRGFSGGDRVFALLGDATLRMLPRGIDEYLERRQRMEEAAAASSPVVAKPVAEKSAADQRAAKKELQKIERQLDKISEKETKLHAQIADNATDFSKVASLDAELREVAGGREELERRWLELAEDA